MIVIYDYPENVRAEAAREVDVRPGRVLSKDGCPQLTSMDFGIGGTAERRPPTANNLARA
jgi:hypothetical protein